MMTQRLRAGSHEQAWKLYVAVMAWPLYLFTLPAVAQVLGIGTLLWMIFPGIYLFCWLGVLMHETAHHYFEGVNNDRFYKLCSLMLFLDPQLFKITHATHHKHVNSYEDRQIHPVGKIDSRRRRALYNLSEILLGDLHFWVFAPLGLLRDPHLRHRYSVAKAVVWNSVWIGGLAITLMLSAWTFDAPPLQVALLYGCAIWMAAVVLRHNEMVQHAQLIVDGSRERRVMATRNLYPRGVLARLFLFLTHNDPLEHVLHHTLPTRCSRWYPNAIPMPDGAVYITMSDYLRLLGQMVLGVAPEDGNADKSDHHATPSNTDRHMKLPAPGDRLHDDGGSRRVA